MVLIGGVQKRDFCPAQPPQMNSWLLIVCRLVISHLVTQWGSGIAGPPITVLPFTPAVGQACVQESKVDFSHGDGFPFEGKEVPGHPLCRHCPSPCPWSGAVGWSLTSDNASSTRHHMPHST